MPLAPLLCLSLLVLTGACSLPAAAHPGLTDVRDGNPAAPLTGAPGELVVLIFGSVDCPVANALAPEMARVARLAAGAGARSYLVYVSPDLQPSEAARHATEHGLDLPLLIDREHALVDALGATVTPEACIYRFVQRDEIQLLYRGRINDLYADLGRRRAVATRHDLREALAAAVGGADQLLPAEPAVGCLIEPLH